MSRKLFVYLLTATMLFTSVDVTVWASETETVTVTGAEQGETQPDESAAEKEPGDNEAVPAGAPAADETEEEKEGIGVSDTQVPEDDAENGNVSDGNTGDDADSENSDGENLSGDTTDEADAQDESALTDEDAEAEQETAAEFVNMDGGVDGTTGKLGTNNNITWTYDAATKTLTVSGEDELHGELDSAFNRISPFDLAYKSKDIERIAFKSCILTGSAEYLFAGLAKIKEIDLSGLDTSNVTNMNEMFRYCKALTMLDVSNFNTGNVTNMGGMFSYCEKLTGLNVNYFDTSNVTDMSSMFFCCESLTRLDINHFDTSKVTDMSRMFCYCENLAKLDVSKFDTSNVTDIDSMFTNCCKLTELDVSKFKTSNVTDMEGVFYDCRSLSRLDVSGFNTSNVVNMESMFNGCNNLCELDVSHFDTRNVSNMSNMFAGCFELVELDVSGFNTSNVVDMRSMFQSCNKLTNLDLSSFDTSNVTGMGSMFSNCNKLPELDVSGFNTSNVTYMWDMFSRCKSLKELDLSSFDTNNVIKMSNMFSDCNNLSQLDISGFETSKVTDMKEMFSGCSELTSLDVSSFDASQVTDMSDMFYNCSSLTTLHTPKTMGSTTADLPATFYDENDTAYTTLSADNTGKLLTTFKQSGAYRVHFDGNGADGSMPDQCIEVNVEKTLTPNTFKKPGYMFTGWNTKADNSGISYADKASVKNLAAAKGTITLYAQWKAVTYTIHFDGNGATEGSLEDITGCVGGKKYTLPENTFKKTDYIFTGWNIRKSGSGTSYTDKAQVQNLCSTDGGTVTLYAQWKGKDTGTDPTDPDRPNDPDDPDEDAENDKDAAYYKEYQGAKQDLKAIGAAVADIKAKTYDGLPYTPTVKVTYKSGTKAVTLTEGTDYLVIYRNNVKAGSGEVIVRGCGSYSGEITKAFTIKPKSAGKLKTVVGGMKLNEQTDKLPIYVYDGDQLLTENVDYTLDPKNITASAGTKNVKITGMGNYDAATGKTVKVTVYDAEQVLKAEDFGLEYDTKDYTGKAIKPGVTNRSGLEKKYYSVKYSNNTNAGTACVTVSGKNGYAGSVVLNFQIVPTVGTLHINKDVPLKAVTYNGKRQRPKIKVTADVVIGGVTKTKTLKAGKDYTVTYSNNLHATPDGSYATVTVTGKGNYAKAGTKKAVFKINPQKISKAKISGTENDYTVRYGKQTLLPGADYTFVEYGTRNKGKVQVKLKGKGDFTGDFVKAVKEAGK